MIALGLRFRFLHSHREVGRPALQRSKEVQDEPVARYLAAGQERGEIRTDLPIQGMRSLIQAMAVAAWTTSTRATSTRRRPPGCSATRWSRSWSRVEPVYPSAGGVGVSGGAGPVLAAAAAMTASARPRQSSSTCISISP